MKLESTVFEENELIPSLYTCDGRDVIPPLTISGVPQEAKSLTLIVNDPDVPTSVRMEGEWDHWIVWNIPPLTTTIPEGQNPAGNTGLNTAGTKGYMGPCPPDREHRYFFLLYALDTVLTLPDNASKEELLKSMEGHIIEKTVLMGRYERSH